MHNLKKLNIWKDALVLDKEVYLITSQFPKEERCSLVSQFNRCSVLSLQILMKGLQEVPTKNLSTFFR